MFSYEHLDLRYQPFPIGIAKPVMDDALYQELLASYPSDELFAYLPELGHKYSLSEKNNGSKYQEFIRSNTAWRELHGWIKSDAFIENVMAVLKERHIDLGYKPSDPAKRMVKTIKNVARGRGLPADGRLSTRFEFSMLPADGGYILPHTDLPSKLVTLIVSMVAADGWDPAFGGGTDVNQPHDVRLAFNRLNRQAEFDDMDVLDTYQFTPNQVVIFVKTFNSWHSVRPMLGVGSPAMRRTLTINIETRN